MLEWSEYLSSVTSSKTALDNIALSCNGLVQHISPIVKASILMLEDMISSQSSHNVFVFPEIRQFSKEFLLGKVIYNIFSGKIQMSYDPKKFVKGQILKYKNCAVEFQRIEEYQGRTLIFVKFSDGMSYGVPVEIAPFFQVSDSKKLSTYKRFCEKYSAQNALKTLNEPEHGHATLETLENYKTHLSGSIFFVSTIKVTREFLTTAELDGKKITEFLYMAQINGDGELSNISTGQLSGNPAIIIASDLYAVQNSIDKGVIPQSIIFDASQANAVDKQLDAFDALGQRNIPIVCITDTAHSFELSSLVERYYDIWRWDNDSITNDLISPEHSTGNTRVINCSKHTTDYKKVDDESISQAVKLLYKQKPEIEDQPPKIVAVYNKLFSLAFSMLRSVVPLEASDRQNCQKIVTECVSDIEACKRYIGTELYSDLLAAAQSLLPVFESKYKNKKYEAICNIILSDQYNSICIIIPERLDRFKYEKYWETLDFPCKIKVMYPLEYQEDLDSIFDLAIIVGWLGNKVMRQVIYGFSSEKFLILTYPCEERWKRAHTRCWNKALNNFGNADIVKKSLSNSKRQVSTTKFENLIDETPVVEVADELDIIEQVIRTSKYKRYSGDTKSSTLVEAYPISFVGGYLAFYRSGHKALVATEIITGDGDKISSKLPEHLDVGDFIIIRESERDIIRDLADKILEKNGKSELRSLSSKWKESLSVESIFSTQDEIYKKLCDNGCKKDFATIRNWMINEDLIQPNAKDDLLYIALATGDDILKEKLDLVFEAGKEIRSVHIQAGRILSQRLKNKIAEYLHTLGTIDTFNVWDPITLQIDDVGQVKILKVIDRGSAISVDSGNTNRLLTE